MLAERRALTLKADASLRCTGVGPGRDSHGFFTCHAREALALFNQVGSDERQVFVTLLAFKHRK